MRTILVLALLAAGCAGQGPSGTGGAADIDTDPDAPLSTTLAARTSRSIAALNALRSNVPLADYYKDGSRVEGCWMNPAGSSLSDVKKAFYCSYPLEFRLCNTVVLLTVDATQVDARFDGYNTCKATVNAAFDGDTLFDFDDDIDSVYKELFLQDTALDDRIAGNLVDLSRPVASGQSFEALTSTIVASLAVEATHDLASGLNQLLSDAQSAGATLP